MTRIDDLRTLPKVRDSGSFLYLERGRLEQEHESVRFVSAIGRYAIPVANLSLLLLGPGVVATHKAIVNATDCGCTVAWSGEDGVRLYAAGLGDTRSAKNLLVQAKAWADPDEHMRVVRAMYEFRFGERVDESDSLRQIRGREGARVREVYRSWSRSTGVEWTGRKYRSQDWEFADPINRALSAASACLYGICHAAVVSVGYSPGLGFVHTGKSLSFVYDIADMYKMEIAVPAAFKAVSSEAADVERTARRALRDEFHNLGLLRHIVSDVEALFHGGVSAGEPSEEDVVGFYAGDIWDPDSVLRGGLNYATDAGVVGEDEANDGANGVDS